MWLLLHGKLIESLGTTQKINEKHFLSMIKLSQSKHPVTQYSREKLKPV